MKVMMGLEIHVHVKSKSKLFCSCPTDYENAEPNEFTCPICLGFPGSKPKVNKKIVDSALMVAKALNCEIAQETFFSRKSYFYPDMAKNFQISQYEIPLARNGFLEITSKKIRIRRVHLEEDPAKLIHVGGTITSAQYVLIDYNRSGIPLLEIVTEPDFETTKEVREFLFKLSSILEHLEIYDASKEAALRVDANISLEGGEKVEIKNITGFANVEKALNYEIVRQKNLKAMGLKVERETRHFDPQTKSTVTLRKKEFEEDYGYIFEPDLPKIEISRDWVEEIERKMPELPDMRIKKFVEIYKISERDAKIIVYTSKAFADFFEECCKIYKNFRNIAKWMVTDLLKCLNWNNLTIGESKVKPNTFIELLELIDSGQITERLGKEIIKEFVASGKSPREIVEEKKLKVLKRKEELEKVVEKVVKGNEKVVEDYRKGNEKALNFLIGLVLKETEMKADPKKVKELILRLIQ
jgi:aspartyl-tRNA(Asn)/glutamyl-tRNA(Gln) amidotransferase subunit B